MHAGMREAGHDGSASSFRRPRLLGPTDEAKSEDGCDGEGEERADPLCELPKSKDLGLPVSRQ